MASNMPTIQPSSVASVGSDVSGDPSDASLRSIRSPKPKSLSVVNVQSTNIQPKESCTYAKQTQTIDSGPEPLRAGKGGGGLDYYTLTYNYDDDDEKYEEDSIPGMGSGGSPSSGTSYNITNSCERNFAFFLSHFIISCFQKKVHNQLLHNDAFSTILVSLLGVKICQISTQSSKL